MLLTLMMKYLNIQVVYLLEKDVFFQNHHVTGRDQTQTHQSLMGMVGSGL